MLALSILVPTRNRAALWRSGWLLDGIRSQTADGLELVVVDDGSDDDTVDFLAARLPRALRFPWTLARCLTLRTGENPASAAPDQVAFGLARAPVILHLDDDLRIHPELAAFALAFDLARRVLWLQLRFLGPDGAPIRGPLGVDSRLKYARGHSVAAPLCARRPLHWGGAYAVRADAVREIGGHSLEHRGYRNADTRLGERLVRSGLQSLLALDPRGIVDHLGPTWYRAHRHDAAAIARSRYPAGLEPVVANGGVEYFASTDFGRSFEIVALSGA